MALITRRQHNNKNIPREEGNFFLSLAFEEAFDSALTRMEVVNDKGESPLALFNLFEFKKMGFKLLITPPFSLNTGLEIVHRSDKLVSQQSETRKVLASIASFICENYSKAYVDLAFPPEITDMRPFLEQDFKATPSYTYTLSLRDKSEKELLAAMSSERRKNIRDAEKRGLKFMVNPSIDLTVDLIEKTLSTQGVNPHSEVIHRLLSTKSEWVYSMGISANENLEAVALIGYDHKKAYYLAGGTSKESGVAGAYALWKCICECRRRGVEYFDFMGSSIPSIERYFRGFGGELTPYFRVKRNTEFLEKLKSAKNRLF